MRGKLDFISEIRGVLLVAQMLVVGAGLAADRVEVLFARGNAEYQKGDYGSAEKLYRQILESGISGSAVYYNLGNACFKNKKLGEAIYYWEKARQLAPADRQIRGNLELASLLVVDRIGVEEAPRALRAAARLQNLLSVEQQSLLVLLLFVTANVCFSIYLFRRGASGSAIALRSAVAFGVVFLILSVSLCWKIYEQDYRRIGIVVEPKVDVRSGPGTGNMAVFTIHEGTKARIHEASNGWYQISLVNGWSGWISSTDIRILN